MVAYVAFDPGLSGAWGVVDHNGKYIGCGDLPNEDKIIDTNAVWDELSNVTRGMDRHFAIEQVSAMPGQGVTSMFTFGGAYMACIAVAQRSRDPWMLVRPRAWKKDMGLTADKDESLALARHLFPTAPLTRKKDNGRAEALLIAEWLRRKDS